MTEKPTHILTVRTQNWTRAEYIEPGRIAPRDKQTEHYRGSVEDCDAIAEAKGVLTMIDEIPATEETPYHSRVYLEPNTDDTGLTELWCLAQPIEKVTPWVEGLPLAGEVFTAAPCPHDRIGECWACQEENNPHAEFAQQMLDASMGLNQPRRAYRDEEDQLERAITRDFGYTAPDEHLEDLYDDQQSGDEDY